MQTKKGPYTCLLTYVTGSSGLRLSLPFQRNYHFVGRNSELLQVEAIIFGHDSYQKIAICGLGGVGKTQIAIELAYRTMEKRPACSIFWIDASSVEKFEQAYFEIGELIQIPGLDEKRTDVKQIVKHKLEQEDSGQWLMILDNADDADIWLGTSQKGSHATGLIGYIPKSKKGAVIFTTRNRKAAVGMAQANVVEIPRMDEVVAADLLENSLFRSTTTEEKKARSTLLSVLTYLPLAIVQAAAYINANDTTVSKYLSLIQDAEDNVIDILSEDFSDKGRYSNSGNAIASTWLISFEQIRIRDTLAAEYLCFMSCLDTQMIPQSLLPPA